MAFSIGLSICLRAASRDLPATQGLYTHFTGVRRLEEIGIFPSAEEPPYPPDDAAVHHVFDGGWIWVLRFNNGVTSAGVAATPALADEVGLAEGAPAWDRLLARLPTVARAVRRRAAGAPLRPQREPAVPERARGGRELGASPVGGGLRGPAALDRISI